MNGNLYSLAEDGSIEVSKPVEMLTIGPDKTSHARGFMWDEGF